MLLERGLLEASTDPLANASEKYMHFRLLVEG
jgi:hypothetical protein